MRHFQEIVQNIKNIKVGNIVRLSCWNRSWEYRTCAGVVKSFVRGKDDTKLVLEDFLDTNHPDNSLKSHTFKWRNVIIDVEGECTYDYKIIIHKASEKTLKGIARKNKKYSELQIAYWNKEIESLENDIEVYRGQIESEKRIIDKLNKRYKI